MEQGKMRRAGLWALAADPSRQVPGTLEEVEPGRYRLELIGTLGTELTSPHVLPAGEHRIVGRLTRNGFMTLEGCHAVAANPFGDIPDQTWLVGQVLNGVLLDCSEPWAFHSASFRIPGLTHWVARATTGVEFDYDDAGKATGFKLTVDTTRWPLWKEAALEVELGRVANTKHTGEAIAQLESRIELLAHCEKRLAADDFSRLVTRPVQTIVSLASGRFTAPTNASVATEPRVSGERLTYFDLHWRPLEIDAHDENTDYAFSLSDVQAIGEHAFQNWAKRAVELEAVVDLYLASIRRVGLAELQFLLVVQALETYHRRTSSVQILSESTWLQLKAELGDLVRKSLPGEAFKSPREAMEAKLHFFNEVSLRRRLSELLQSVGNLESKIAAGNSKAFVRRVTEVRNFFTHWTAKDGKEPIERGPELAYLTYRLLGLLELLLLREVGFETSSPAALEVIRRRVSWLPTRSN